jgi:GTPase Era involved in 16S rRNA processing
VSERRRGSPDIDSRIEAIEQAIKVGGDRFDPEAVAVARHALDRTGERMRLSSRHTVVALAGATGSGKSSLFNALAAMEVSEVGARRPTTGKPMACVWGSDGADPLLDWLDVPRRHRRERESILDADRQSSLHGLVLLDLPDHDSTVVTHRLEVDRLVDLVDLLVWVVDPQKYADEALHAGYLKRFAGHESVMLVVLNQIDRLEPEEAQTCQRDLRRLLDADGLDAVRVVATSATRGDGIDELRGILADVVQRQSMTAQRSAADLDGARHALSASMAPTEPDARSLPGADELVGALAAAAGLPVVLGAVEADYRRRAAAATGWPPARWWQALRPDPLRRLRLGGAAEGELRELTRTSLPAPTPSQQARVEIAVRAVTTSAARALPTRWGDAVRRASTPPGEDLSDALDAAVLSVDLSHRRPTWWAVCNAVQYVLLAAAVVGTLWFLWLFTLAIVGTYPGAPSIGPVAWPSLLFYGGLLGGLALAAGCQWFVRVGARRRRNKVAALLRQAVSAVAFEHVVSPVAEVLADHRATRQSLEAAR